VLAIRDYEKGDYLVLATRAGLVKKTRLTDYDSPRSGGLIAINLRDGDELVGAGLASNRDDLLLVSRKGQSVRFTATDEALRPMGRSTSGVTGMKFRAGDHLLAMAVVEEGESPDVFVVFENGLAKRTPVSEYRLQGRGGLGIQVAKLSDKGGDLVGALTVSETDEVMVVMEKGKIVRSRVSEVRHTGRSTQGVKFATPDKGDSIVAVARNAESATEAELEEALDGIPAGGGAGAVGVDEATNGVSGASADGAPATVPGPDGVPSDETGTNDASSEGDSGGDE
jgi:DNA gyrase subunit A